MQDDFTKLPLSLSYNFNIEYVVRHILNIISYFNLHALEQMRTSLPLFIHFTFFCIECLIRCAVFDVTIFFSLCTRLKDAIIYILRHILKSCVRMKPFHQNIFLRICVSFSFIFVHPIFFFFSCSPFHFRESFTSLSSSLPLPSCILIL